MELIARILAGTASIIAAVVVVAIGSVLFLFSGAIFTGLMIAGSIVILISFIAMGFMEAFTGDSDPPDIKEVSEPLE